MTTLIALTLTAAIAMADTLNTAQSFDTTLPFATSDPGTKLPDITWGLDAAWISESNMHRGLNFAGEDLIQLVRISFQTTDAVADDLTLSTSQQQTLNQRIRLAKMATQATVNINSDQEAGVIAWYHTSTSAQQPQVYAARWANLIAATKQYAEASGLTVSSVSPFNEPDYSSWNQGSKAEMNAICRLLRQREEFDGVALCGGNTLNCDEALSWYSACKDNLDEACTHQLAGDMNHFAAFFQQAVADGKVAVDDELHNTMEAIVGSHYGMTKGIWWGTCDHTRSQFMRASRGNRLGYAENRNSWTAAAVYRHPDGKVQAFGGTSERQAATTTYRLVATDHDVFYNGHGPTREYLLTLPGGTGYQQGQTNAETVVDIQDGDDIMPPLPTAATTYRIVNRASGLVLSTYANSVTNATALAQEKVTTGLSGRTQQWIISPVSPRVGGDFSYFKICNARDTTLLLDVRDWSLEDRGGLIAYKGSMGDNEQWFLEYAGDGWFYIRSRHSGLCIEVTPGSDAQVKMARRALCQGIVTGDATQQWRLLPTDVIYKASTPQAPQDLAATAEASSVQLAWSAIDEAQHYQVLRSTDGQTWHTLHAWVTDTTYIDRSAMAGTAYFYKVKMVDACLNRSTDSPIATASPTGTPSLVYAMTADTTYALDGLTTYLQLPPALTHNDEMTISLRIYWRGGSTWQRIFDFGTDETHYCALTPSCGSGPRLILNNGSGEQAVGLGSSFGAMRWRTVTATFSREAIRIYFDGKQVGSIDNPTITPADIHAAFANIGRSQFPADPLLKGKIADLRIYNYALSPDEVNELATNIDNLYGNDNDSPRVEQQNSTCYDLSGRRLQTTRPGVPYIQNGRLMMLKAKQP